MKTFSKLFATRVADKLLVILLLYGAFDMLTSPSESTASAGLEAVNKKQLKPIAFVEVRSAIRSAAFVGGVLRISTVLVLFLLCCDLWELWTARGKRSVAAVGSRPE